MRNSKRVHFRELQILVGALNVEARLITSKVEVFRLIFAAGGPPSQPKIRGFSRDHVQHVPTK